MNLVEKPAYGLVKKLMGIVSFPLKIVGITILVGLTTLVVAVYLAVMILMWGVSQILDKTP